MKDSRTPPNIYNLKNASDGLLSVYSSKQSPPMSPAHSLVISNQFLGYEQRNKRKALTYRGMPSPARSSPVNAQIKYQQNDISLTVRNKEPSPIRNFIPQQQTQEHSHIPAYVKFRALMSQRNSFKPLQKSKKLYEVNDRERVFSAQNIEISQRSKDTVMHISALQTQAVQQPKVFDSPSFKKYYNQIVSRTEQKQVGEIRLFSPKISHELDEKIDSKHEYTTLNSNQSRLSREASISHAQVFTPNSQVIKVKKNQPHKIFGMPNQTMVNFPKIHIQSTSRDFLVNSFSLQKQSIDTEKQSERSIHIQPDYSLNPLLRKKWLNKRHQQLVESGGVSAAGANSLSVKQSIDEIQNTVIKIRLQGRGLHFRQDKQSPLSQQSTFILENSNDEYLPRNDTLSRINPPNFKSDLN